QLAGLHFAQCAQEQFGPGVLELGLVGECSPPRSRSRLAVEEPKDVPCDRAQAHPLGELRPGIGCELFDDLGARASPRLAYIFRKTIAVGLRQQPWTVVGGP